MEESGVMNSSERKVKMQEDWEQAEIKEKGESVELTQREMCEKRIAQKKEVREDRFWLRNKKMEAMKGKERARKNYLQRMILIKMERSKKNRWNHICPT